MKIVTIIKTVNNKKPIIHGLFCDHLCCLRSDLGGELEFLLHLRLDLLLHGGRTLSIEGRLELHSIFGTERTIGDETVDGLQERLLATESTGERITGDVLGSRPNDLLGLSIAGRLLDDAEGRARERLERIQLVVPTALEFGLQHGRAGSANGSSGDLAINRNDSASPGFAVEKVGDVQIIANTSLHC